MRTALTVSLVTCLAVPSMAQPTPQTVRLTLSNDLPFARIAEPVTCGVPLVRGFAPSPGELALVDEGGKPVPVQVTATSTYHDGTPRWVLLRFAADVPASGQTAYLLTRGQPGLAGRSVECRLADGVATVNTGLAEFVVDTTAGELLTSASVGGRRLGGPISASCLRLAGSEELLAATISSAEFEEAGPLQAVLCLRGDLGPGEPLPLARFVCRLHFRAGSSEVRVTYTLHNPGAHVHPGNTWDLGTGGSVFMEDLSVALQLAEGTWTSRVGVAAGQSPVPGTQLYQDSSGGPNWRSANHVNKDMQVPVSFRGYRVFNGAEQVAEGERAEGWLHVRTDQGGVAVSVRDFWQNFPKALSLDGGTLRIGLWPAEFADVHELLGGEQKTHELLYVFHGPETDDETVARRMQAFQHPLYAMPEADSVFATRVFSPAAPLDRDSFGAMERTCDSFVDPVGERRQSVIGRWEDIDEFGWRHFGDTFADNESAPPEMRRDYPDHFVGSQPISHFGNEYDVAYCVMLQGLRRQDPRWMWLADVLCRHYADVCIYHTGADGAAAYAHGPFTHTTHETAALRSTHRIYPSETERYGLQYASGGPNAGHCYVASLAQHYYLTGDRVSRDAFLEVADWAVESPWFTEMMMGDQRGIGNFLNTHVYAYAMTGDQKYYDAALAMLDHVQEPFSGLGGTLFAKAAGRFLDLKLENGELDADYERARAKLLQFGDLYLTLPDDEPQRWLEQACFYAEVLFTCYLHAPTEDPRREQYFARGKGIMDAVSSRWPGTYMPTKSLVMCFANTGAYLRALQVHAAGGD